MPFYEKEPRGTAYETDTHFVHIFGRDRGLWTISIGLTATERKAGPLQDWVETTFGAEEIEEANIEVGHTVEGIWRPGLFYLSETLQGLSATAVELRLAEQVLLLFMQRLDELLHFCRAVGRHTDSLQPQGARAPHSRLHGSGELFQALLTKRKYPAATEWRLHDQ